MIKRFCFLSAILFLITSCAVKKDKTNRYNRSLREDYKKVYFTDCLKHGFNKSGKIKDILKEDFSTNSDFVHGLRNYNIIGSLARATNKEIKKDSIEFYNNWKVRGKRVFTECLNGYTSKWLDSMAINTYRLNK